MKKYAGLITNDVVNGEGICVSFWVQGCPHHCVGCFNRETWDKDGGEPLPTDIVGQIVKAISTNGIQRNFSILGGEPLCNWNINLVIDIVERVRMAYPAIKIFLWTGYNMESLLESAERHNKVWAVLDKIDVLIDGKFIEEQKDLTLHLRGSRNQTIWRKIDGIWTADTSNL